MRDLSLEALPKNSGRFKYLSDVFPPQIVDDFKDCSRGFKGQNAILCTTLCILVKLINYNIYL